MQLHARRKMMQVCSREDKHWSGYFALPHPDIFGGIEALDRFA